MVKKKLAIVIGSLGVGGAENMVYQLVKNIDVKIFEVKIFSIHGRTGSLLEQKIELSGLKVEYIEGVRRVNPKGIMIVWKKLSQFSPDIIHTHIDGTIFSVPWAFFHKGSMITTLHTIPQRAFNRKVELVMRFMTKINKAILVAVSPENKEQVMKYYGISDKKVRMVRNGIDINSYYKRNHKDFTFINVGRHDGVKNQKMIIEAFAKYIKYHGNARLILVGDGQERSKLEGLANQLSVAECIDFPGMVPNVEDYLASADVYIQSSHREGLPLAVLEAMATKLPIISTNVGGMKDIVKNNGILIPDNDVEQLVYAMSDLASDNILRNSMSEISFDIVKDFSSIKMAKDYCKIYTEIINN
jgi:glycosyltransferase involved in cell wall biosynthesis